MKPFDKVSAIIAFENGELDGESIIELFQNLIDSGEVWHLQGFYGRTAKNMIDAGICTYGPKRVKDFYGNTVPSKFDVEEKSK